MLIQSSLAYFKANRRELSHIGLLELHTPFQTRNANPNGEMQLKSMKLTQLLPLMTNDSINLERGFAQIDEHIVSG